jgi:hypothetical protein
MSGAVLAFWVYANRTGTAPIYATGLLPTPGAQRCLSWAIAVVFARLPQC